MDMEVYIKELICSSILGLNYKNSKKKKLSTKELWKFFKNFMFLEKKKKKKKEKKKEKKESILCKISLALNVLLTSRMFGADKKDCLCQQLPNHL